MKNENNMNLTAKSQEDISGHFDNLRMQNDETLAEQLERSGLERKKLAQREIELTRLSVILSNQITALQVRLVLAERVIEVARDSLIYSDEFSEIDARRALRKSLAEWDSLNEGKVKE